MKRLIVFIVPVLFLGVGCETVGQRSYFPDQKVNVEDSLKARIYVLRPAAVLGSAVPMSIRDGDRLVGVTLGGIYISWERIPGDVELTSKSENQYKLKIHVEAGQRYYVMQRVQPGFLRYRTSLELLTQEEGKKYLSQCRPAKLTGEDAKKGYQSFQSF